jgi:hypothetical protein
MSSIRGNPAHILWKTRMQRWEDPKGCGGIDPLADRRIHGSPPHNCLLPHSTFILHHGCET